MTKRSQITIKSVGLITSVCLAMVASPAIAAQLRAGDRAPALQIADDINLAGQGSVGQANLQTSPRSGLAAATLNLKVPELKADEWYWQWAAIIGFAGIVIVVCFKNPKRTDSN